MARLIAVLMLLTTAALAGCTPRSVTEAQRATIAYQLGDFGAARQRLRPLAEETNENFVLNNARLGSAALVDYELDEAEAAFLRAYEVMNSLGVNNGGRTLGAVLVDEKIRIWRGEPFERAMANFYLGLVFYMRQDYLNARGAFENALFKLRDYEPEAREEADAYREVESGFVLGHLMLARSWQRLGREDLAQANFDRVGELRPDLAALADPAVHARSNVLLVVDYGWGPRKITDFDGSIVGLGPKPYEAGPIPLPRVIVSGRVMGGMEELARPTVDLLALAQERRWQSIDTLRTVKSGIGTGLIAAGAGYGVYRMGNSRGQDGTDALVSLGLIGAGLLLKATSQADTRMWEMLPRSVFVLPLKLEPGTHEITVDFVGSVSQTWRGIEAPAEGERTYYLRMQRYREGPFDWPPPALAPVPPTPPTESPMLDPAWTPPPGSS